MKATRTAEDIRASAERDEALPLVELAVATGYRYNPLLKLAKRPGFPKRLGKVIPSEFRAWIREQPVDNPATASTQPAEQLAAA